MILNFTKNYFLTFIFSLKYFLNFYLKKNGKNNWSFIVLEVI